MDSFNKEVKRKFIDYTDVRQRFSREQNRDKNNIFQIYATRKRVYKKSFPISVRVLLESYKFNVVFSREGFLQQTLSQREQHEITSPSSLIEKFGE